MSLAMKDRKPATRGDVASLRERIEDLEDLIVPDPAERVGAGGRLQE